MDKIKALNLQKEILEQKMRLFTKDMAFKVVLLEEAVEEELKKNKIKATEYGYRHEPEPKVPGVKDIDIEFDLWWMRNWEKLVKIYHTEIDPNIAVMKIAEISWEGAVCLRDSANSPGRKRERGLKR